MHGQARSMVVPNVVWLQSWEANFKGMVKVRAKRGAPFGSPDTVQTEVENAGPNAKYGRAQRRLAAILYTGMGRTNQRHGRGSGQEWRPVRKFILNVWASSSTLATITARCPRVARLVFMSGEEGI